MRKPYRHYAAKLIRRAINDRDGIAATEFSLLLPIMVVLFFGMLELSEGMTANRRVAIAVNAAADLAAQDEQLTPNEVDALMDAVTAILEPAATNVVDINLISVVLDNNDDPVVHWSLHWNDNVSALPPYAAGTDYSELSSNFQNSSDGLIRLKNRSMIIVEMSYPYQPKFAKYFVSDPIQFDRSAKRAPRLVTRVQLCDNTETVCTS